MCIRDSTYDAVGNLKTNTGGNGLTHRYTYSNLNRLTHLSVGQLSDASDTLSAFSTLAATHSYQLNNSGHRTQVTDYRAAGLAPSFERTINYTYDALYRLTSETITPTDSLNPIRGTVNYTHDSVGNRTSRVTDNAVLRSILPNQAFGYNSNDQLDDHTHDANGNTTSSPAPTNSLTGITSSNSDATDTYDFRNKLIRREYDDGTTIDLTYNADALLVRKNTNKLNTSTLTNFLQDTNNHTGYAQIVEEITDNVFALNVLGHDLTHTHQIITSPLTGAPEWKTHFYLYDGLGSVRNLTNETGLITDTFDYDAFGPLIASTGDTPNAYLYTGERFDPDLGFYYLRARYLDPNLGRFHTLDTYEGRNGEPLTLHKYLYTCLLYTSPSPRDRG